MRNSYDWRSAIVHGDFRKPKKLKELNKKCTLSQATEITLESYDVKAITGGTDAVVEVTVN